MKPSRRDLLNAVEHASVSSSEEDFSLEDFDLEYLGNLTRDELSYYDSFSGWLDIEEGDFSDATEEERFDELEHFRGEEWAKRALLWLETGKIPPIVVITYPSDDSFMTEIGDGRGRVNFANLFDIERLEVWHLKHKDYKDS